MRQFKIEVASLLDIAKKYGIESVSQKLNQFESEATNFSVKVLFVGGFSSGKSALINALLQGRELLEEGLSPTTAIPAEVMYGIENTVTLFGDDATSICPLEDDTYKSKLSKHRKCVYRLENDFLYNNKDFIFVDMPGFDAFNDGHDKAIATYAADSGNAYILCVNCDDGTLSKSVADGLREIRSYTKNIACIITKSDKIPASTCEKIKILVKEAAETIFRERVTTLIASAVDDSAIAAVTQILSGFDVNNLFRQKFSPHLTEICEILKCSLESVKNSASLDNDEEERKIKKLLRDKAELESLFKRKKSMLNSRFSSKVKPAILNDVKKVLEDSSASLAESAKSSADNFLYTVNNIARPAIVTSMQNRTNVEITDFVGDFHINLDDDSGIDIDVFQAKANQIFQILHEGDNNKTHSNNIYKTVVGIAGITTAVVKPWIEAVMLFLPDIVSFVSRMLGNDPTDKIVDQVIPKILNQLSPKIDEALKNIENDVIDKITEIFYDNLTANDQAVSMVKQQKEQNVKEYEQLIADVAADLKRLDEILEVVKYA